jgi:hypothetical protein
MFKYICPEYITGDIRLKLNITGKCPQSQTQYTGRFGSFDSSVSHATSISDPSCRHHPHHLVGNQKRDDRPSYMPPGMPSSGLRSAGRFGSERSRFTTCAVVGRLSGSWSQQVSTRFQTAWVKPRFLLSSCTGRTGLLPPITLVTTA